MYRTVLVPLDGSTFAEHALPHAALIAEAAGAELHLLLVHQSLEMWDAGRPAELERRWARDLRDREIRYLAHVAAALNGAIAVETALLDGVVPDTITRYAREREVDLIVMTTHARGGLERAWLGSVADAVIRAGPVPVLVVRPAAGTRTIGEPLPAPRRIAAAWDGSEPAQRALDHALAMATLFAAELLLIHVVAPHLGPNSPYIPHAAQLDREILEHRRSAAEAEFAELERRLAEREPPPVPVRTCVLTHHQPVRGLLEAMVDAEIDMIAIGTHGRGTIGRAVLGSVSDKLLRSVDLPVLVSRAP